MPINHKDNMVKTIAGEATQRIPYAPRLDLWYRANKLAGTLPEKYSNSTLMEITDDLGIGYHAIVPNFKDLRSLNDEIDRGLGVFNLWFMPYQTVFKNVQRKVTLDGNHTIVEYVTPKGTIRTVTVYDDSMRKAGVTITHIAEYAFKNSGDYPALAYIFEHAEVAANYEGYQKFADSIGDRGLAAGFVSLAASPMHLVLRELMPFETLFYEIHDRSYQMRELSKSIEIYWEKVLKVVSESPAQLVFVGANYDASWTIPPFFEEHIMPWLKKASDLLHKKNKLLLTHIDGENTGLLNHYLHSGIDVADSICPKPMTKLSFQEVREHFAGRITIMGGIPSVALVESTFTDDEFEGFLDDFFGQIGKGDHLILGISDTTPPAAKWDRIVKINERVKAFGTIN